MGGCAGSVTGSSSPDPARAGPVCACASRGRGRASGSSPPASRRPSHAQDRCSVPLEPLHSAARDGPVAVADYHTLNLPDPRRAVKGPRRHPPPVRRPSHAAYRTSVPLEHRVVLLAGLARTLLPPIDHLLAPHERRAHRPPGHRRGPLRRRRQGERGGVNGRLDGPAHRRGEGRRGRRPSPRCRRRQYYVIPGPRHHGGRGGGGKATVAAGRPGGPVRAGRRSPGSDCFSAISSH